MSEPILPSGTRVPVELAEFSPQEAAELYIAGAMSDAEMAAMARMLEARVVEYVAAMRAAAPAGEALLSAAGEVAPPRVLKAAVMARVEGDLTAHDAAEYARLTGDSAEQPGQAEHAQHELASAGVSAGDALVILRASTQRWRATGVRGVRYRTLVADRTHNRRTILLQMDPGTSLPDHGHAGLEEVFVVSGDLSIGDEKLSAGDYFRVPPGVEHGTPRSTHGCTAIIISGYSPFPIKSIPTIIWQTILGWFGKR
jgi:quercetin dioxygenase-like cupin family protein